MNRFVEFRHVVAKSSSAATTTGSLKSYRGIQVSIMRYKHFRDLIDPKQFCCTAYDAQDICPHVDQSLVQKPPDESYGDVDVYMHTVDFATEADETVRADDEGETCICTGTVDYGRKFVSGEPGIGTTTVRHLEELLH